MNKSLTEHPLLITVIGGVFTITATLLAVALPGYINQGSQSETTSSSTASTNTTSVSASSVSTANIIPQLPSSDLKLISSSDTKKPADKAA